MTLQAVKNVAELSNNIVFPLPIMSEFKGLLNASRVLTFDTIPVALSGAAIAALTLGGGAAASIGIGFAGAMAAVVLLFISTPYSLKVI